MIRAKTKHRLALLLVVGIVGTGLAGGFAVVRRTYLRNHARHSGEIGIAAAKSGDYATALPALAIYLSRFPQDINALHFYALSRQHVEEPDDRQLGEAIVLWRRVIDANPDDLDARHQLLDIYVDVGFSTETLEGANALLDRVKDDPDALRAKAIALLRLRKYADSAATISHLNELHPENFDNELLALTIESAKGASPQDLVKQADVLRKAHPDDVHFALLQSIALANAGDRTAAASAIRDVIGKPIVDPATLTMLLNQLDSLGLFDESLASARAAASAHPGAADYQRLLANRLLIAADYTELDALLKPLSPSDTSADGQLLALKGISLALQSNVKDALPIFAAISSRPSGSTDHLAAALASAATITWTDSADPKARVQTCKQALEADAKNPLLHYFLAQAYAQQQNTDGALGEWQSAVKNAPAWALPLTRCAQVLLRAQRPQDAYAMAQAAHTRAPNERDTLITLATTWSAAININQTDDVNKLLALFRDIGSRFPESQEIRPLFIDLLAHTGHADDARSEFQAALDASPPPSENTLLQLAIVSRINKLQLEDACYTLSEKVHGMSPALALAKASWLAGTGKPKDGLAIFENIIPGKSTDATWRLDYARFLGAVDDPRAKATWIAIADAFPTNTNIQWAALTAPSIQDDHDFQGKVIQRLRDQLGPNNMEGRLAQALWLLQGQPTDKQISEASVILSDLTRAAPNLAEPRILLANCLQKLGNTTAAVDQLRVAAQASPDDNSIRLKLASLLATEGESADARLQLEKVAQTAASPAERQQAASQFFALGDHDRAAQLLQSDADGNSRLMLADFYLQQNDPAKAEAIAHELMQKPTPAIIGLYASAIAAQNRQAQAESVLAQLDALNTTPAARALVRAQYFDRYGKPEDALAQYLAATAASPKDAAIWRQLLLFCLRSDRLDDLTKYLASARQAAPNDAGFSALSDNLPSLKIVAADSTDRTLYVALLSDASNIPAYVQAIHLATSTSPATQVLAQVRQLADANPRLLPIQLFAAHFCSLFKQNDDAVALSTRAMQAFPNSAQAAQIATECLAVAGKWKEALAAAHTWRDRSPGQTADADIAIAAATSQLGDPNAGIAGLKPYLDRALKSPDDYPRIILLYVQDLLATNQMDQAAQVLQPLLSESRWRVVWLQFAATIPDPAARASWIDRVAPSIPADLPNERALLALTYQQLAAKNPAYEQKVHDIADSLAARSDAPPNVLAAVGAMYESEKNPAAAEKAYSQVLAKDPKNSLALNNLAMLLVYSGKDTGQAADLAQRAIAADPDAPGLYDSQAIVLGTEHHFDGALTSAAQAMKLDPANPNWKATYIWLLAQAGKRDVAASQYKQLQDARLVSTLSENSRKRLSTVGLQ